MQRRQQAEHFRGGFCPLEVGKSFDERLALLRVTYFELFDQTQLIDPAWVILKLVVGRSSLAGWIM